MQNLIELSEGSRAREIASSIFVGYDTERIVYVLGTAWREALERQVQSKTYVASQKKTALTTGVLGYAEPSSGQQGEKMSTVMRPSGRPNSLCRREFLTMLRALSGLVLIAGLPGVIKAE